MTINSFEEMMSKTRISFIIVIVFFATTHIDLAYTGETNQQWESLAKGIEYGIFQVKLFQANGEAIIHIVRIDPANAKLKLLLASEHRKESRTTAQWCKEFNLISAINAGMYQKDLFTNVGYLRNGSHIQNKHWNSKYKSVLAFDPKKAGIPPAIMVDIDEHDAKNRLSNYNAIVQNLRLIKGNGSNVWAQSEKQWSEAAVGMDRDGRVLFLFCQKKLPMRDFNEGIKSLRLGVIRMMHVEGGVIASLSIRTPAITRNLAGSYETVIQSDSVNKEQWPIPNAIGVQKR